MLGCADARAETAPHRAVGAAVTGFALGDEVFGMSTSTSAEYAAAPNRAAASGVGGARSGRTAAV